MNRIVASLLFIIGLAGYGFAAPTLVQCKDDAAQALVATSVWKVNLPSASIAGNTLTVAAVIGNATTTVTVTDSKSNTWNNALKIPDAGNNTGIQMAYTSGGIAAGATQVTVTYSVARSFNQVEVCEWSNVKTASPLDGQSGRATTGSGGPPASIATAGTLTSTVNGDLIICSTFLDNWPVQHAPMAWTAGSGTNTATMAIATENPTSYMVTEYGIQATSSLTSSFTVLSSITPTGSGAVISCISLQAASSGGTLPAGIQALGISVQSLENSTIYASYTGTSFTFQFPVRGNLIAMGWTGRPTNEPTTVVSSPSLSWVHCAASTDSGGSGNATWWWYAPGASAGLYTITVSGFGSTPSASIHNFVDVGGAATTQAVTPVCAGAMGTQTDTMPVPGPTITPAAINGMVLTVAQEDRNTVTNVSPGIFNATDVGVYSGSSGDTDEGLAVYLNATTSNVSTVWTYSSYEGGADGPGAYASQSVFLAVAVAAPTPTLTSLNPTSGTQGTAPTIHLVGTGFTGGNVTVNVSGTNVTAGTPSSVSDTDMDSVFTIGAGATANARNVTVTTDGGTSGAQTFTVNASSSGGATCTSFVLMGVGGCR